MLRVSQCTIGPYGDKSLQRIDYTDIDYQMQKIQKYTKQQQQNAYKKLRYRRETAWCAVSAKTRVNVANMFDKLHLISPALGEWLFKVIQGHWKWHE